MKPIMPILERGNGLELTRVRLPASRLRGGDALGLGQGSRRFPSVHTLEKEEYAMRRSGLLVMLVTLGLTVLGALGVAHALTTISFDLVPASAAVANCLPHATGDVTVLHKEESAGRGYLAFGCQRSAVQHGLCGLSDLGRRLREAALRRGGLYRGLHHERGGYRIAQGRCDHRRGFR